MGEDKNAETRMNIKCSNMSWWFEWVRVRKGEHAAGRREAADDEVWDLQMVFGGRKDSRKASIRFRSFPRGPPSTEECELPLPPRSFFDRQVPLNPRWICPRGKLSCDPQSHIHNLHPADRASWQLITLISAGQPNGFRSPVSHHLVMAVITLSAFCYFTTVYISDQSAPQLRRAAEQQKKKSLESAIAGLDVTFFPPTPQPHPVFRRIARFSRQLPQIPTPPPHAVVGNIGFWSDGRRLCFRVCLHNWFTRRERYCFGSLPSLMQSKWSME